MATDRSKLEYEINRSKDDRFYVTIRGPGGRANLARSQLYKSKRSASNMIRILKESAADGEIEDNT